MAALLPAELPGRMILTMRNQVVTTDQVNQAKIGLAVLIVMLCAYAGAGLGLFVMNLVLGMKAMAVWNAAWLLFVPWFAIRTVYELRRSNRVLRALAGDRCPGHTL